ncbi:MAG: nickel pincer cofactor biosynthesis protein LarC [Deltaproteobacteria bacterium]|nr:MAG: nickel pincer cofactor biosynthesis protein LarC [Deltaproteobacteria bacterium]
MKIAYLDCFSGISGDMLLGALLDAGLDLETLRKALATLPLDGYSLEMKREERGRLFGTLFLVRVEKERQEHRGLKDIVKIIQAGGLSQTVQNRSIQIFESLAQEEAKIHNCPFDEVHFHEVGALDSIIDIVGSVFGIECLDIASISASSLPLGSGFVETQHGRIPVPAPATLALLNGIPVYDSGLEHELVTPTGAALVKGLASTFGSMPAMTIDRVGYGVGSRALPDRPNLLRIIIGLDQTEQQVETVVTLEANLDDTHPEWLGFLMGRLFEAGALDVTFCPIQMKKNRPGILVQVMGKPEQRDTLMDILFRESTTLGIRFHYSQRKVLARSEVEVDSPWGKMRVKEVLRPDGKSYFLPEYEVCRKIAEQRKIPIREVYGWVTSLNKT